MVKIGGCANNRRRAYDRENTVFLCFAPLHKNIDVRTMMEIAGPEAYILDEGVHLVIRTRQCSALTQMNWH